VFLTSPAESDLVGISDYITFELGEPSIAKNLISRIKKAVLSLDEMPHRHAEIDASLVGVNGVRFRVESNYLIFYKINEYDTSVRVLRILYGKRDWQSILNNSSLVE